MEEYINTIKNIVDSFMKMCDFIEHEDNIGCGSCPVFKECFREGKHDKLYQLRLFLGIKE